MNIKVFTGFWSDVKSINIATLSYEWPGYQRRTSI